MMHSLSRPKRSCTICIARRFTCDGGDTTCSACETHQYVCDWQGIVGKHVFELFPEAFHLNGKLTPKYPQAPPEAVFLGTGGFGIVYLAKLRGFGAVAVKMPHLRSQVPVRHLALCLREALTWSRLNHAHVVRFLGITNDPDPKSICFVSEYMENGEKMKYLIARPDTKRIPLLGQIARGLSYLHNLSPPVVHGDIKGSNVLVSNEGTALLTDFGLSYIIEDSSMQMDTTSTALGGNPRWLAPERIRPELHGTSAHASRTPASDMFSLSRTFYEVLADQEPYYGENPYQVADFVQHNIHPPHPGDLAVARGLREELWALMNQAWNADPVQRPSAVEVETFVTDWA